MLVPIPGTEAEPWQGKCRALVTGPPGNSQVLIFILKTLQITNEEKIKYLLINVYISGAEMTIIIINNIIITNEETEV